MLIQRKKIYEVCQVLINILVALLTCSFTILSTYSWGTYVMIGCLLLIVLLDVFRQEMHYSFRLGRYLVFMIAFCAYTLFSSIMAINPSDSITNAMTLLQMIMMIFVVEQVYARQENGVRTLLTILKWTSYAIVVYSIIFYGIDSLRMLAVSGQRMKNSYANVNIIGMLAAVGVVIQLDEMLRERRFKIASVMCVPAVLLLALTQSRKALLLFVLGSVMVVLMRTVSGNWRKTLLKLIAAGVILLLGWSLLSSFEIFSGVFERIYGLVSGILGINEGDASTSLRSRMVEVGWQQFKETPLFGIGMGNAHYVAAQEIGINVYLHNNFIELLVGGGLIGFGIYYAMYGALFFSFFRYRKYKNDTYVLCLTLAILMLIMDYGRVTYYDKMNYFYLLMFFLETDALKKNATHHSTKEQ